MVCADTFEMLTNGSYFGAVHCMYYAVIGDWWIIILYILTIFLTLIGTKNEGAVAGVSIVGAFAIRYYINPASQPIIYMLAAFSLAMILYRAIKNSDR